MAKRWKNLKVRLSQKVRDNKNKCMECKNYFDEAVYNECFLTELNLIDYDIQTQKNCMKFSASPKCIGCFFYGFDITEKTNTCAKRKLIDFNVHDKRYCKKYKAFYLPF